MSWKIAALTIVAAAAAAGGVAAFAQKPNERYTLAAINSPGDIAVWRMNTRTGALQVCYMRSGALMCTPATNGE